MVKCVFCGRDEEPFKGLHLIRNDGRIDYFCSSKCRRNALNLKRDRRKVKWTEAYRAKKGKKEVETEKKKE